MGSSLSSSTTSSQVDDDEFHPAHSTNNSSNNLTEHNHHHLHHPPHNNTTTSPPTPTPGKPLPRINTNWAFQQAVLHTLNRRSHIDALWSALEEGSPPLTDTPTPLQSHRRPPLPKEVIPSILHFAAYYEEITLTKQAPVQITNGGYIYLRHTIPSHLPHHVCVRAKINVSSHDQGWSSQHTNLQGTYMGSYTWGTAEVEEEDDRTEGGERKVVVERECYRNLHAVRAWQEHGKVFTKEEGEGEEVGSSYSYSCGSGGRKGSGSSNNSSDGGGGGEEQKDEEAEAQHSFSEDGDLIAALRPGRALCLRLHAMYAGWINYTRQASITLYYLRVD